MDDLQEILEDFLVEAFELIEQMDQDLIELENSPDDLELLNGIFRVAHTVKGSSSFLNFDILTELTHHMEDVLNKARKDELKITPEIMDVILESVDMIKALLEGIKESGTDADCGIEIADICKRLDAVSKGNASEENSNEEDKDKDEDEEKSVDKQLVEEDTTDYSSFSDDEVEAEIEPLLAEKQKEKKAKKQKKKTQPVVKKIEANESDKPKAKKQPSTPEQTIRVEVKRLDHLMNLIGELVLGKNRLLKIYDDVEERYEGEKFLEELNQVVSSVSLVTTDLQIAVMKTRMLPVSKVFNRFPRLVRDLSRELKKDIELVMSGEETEL
jgi:two-component system chemotaxis sensor kinase CheA